MRDKVKSYMKTLINEKSTGVDKEYHELQKGIGRCLENLFPQRCCHQG